MDFTPIRALLAFYLLLMLAACSTVRITDDIAVSHPRFAVSLKRSGQTNWSEVCTTRFPWKKHQIYYWSLDVHTDRTNAMWYTIYQYPGPSEYLRNLSNDWQEVTADASRFITKPERLPGDGRIHAVCVVMPGEPPGDYAIIPFVNHVPVHTFRYVMYGERGVVATSDQPSGQPSETAKFSEGFVQDATANAQTTVAHSNAVALALSPSAFSASPEEASSRLLAETKYKRMDDGRSLDTGDLSKPIAEAVERLGRIVIPSVEFRQTAPKDILRFIAAAPTMPEPDKMESIGLIHGAEEPGLTVTDGKATELIDELPLDSTPLTLSLQRVNLLELVERLSKALNVDAGLTREGQIVFGRNDKWSSRSSPAYLMQFAE